MSLQVTHRQVFHRWYRPEGDRQVPLRAKSRFEFLWAKSGRLARPKPSLHQSSGLVAHPGLKPHRTRDKSDAGLGLHKPENHAIDHAKPPPGRHRTGLILG